MNILREIKFVAIASAMMAGALFFILGASVAVAGDTVYIPMASVWSVIADAFGDWWFWGIFFFGTSALAFFVRRLNKEMMSGGLSKGKWRS